MSPLPGGARDRTEGGALVARALAGSWRASPPPLDLSRGALGDVAPRLLKTGAGPLGWWRVRGSPLEEARGSRDLRQAYRLGILRAALHERQLREALPRLRAAGIEPLLGKGWAVARLYPDAGLRPYGDVDLYLPCGQGDAASRALVGLGFVDLHPGFAELSDRDPGELVRRSQLFDLEGVTLRAFGPEDHLRLLALHMLRHGVLRPLWLCDVALALESRPADFDWDYFQTGSRRRTDWVVGALGLAQALLDARLDGLPGPVAERIRRLPSWLTRVVLREWGGFRPPHGARTPFAQELRDPRGLRAALRLRWPNAVEATVGTGAPLNALPRLPFQLGECLRRAARFAVGLTLAPGGRR